MNPGELPLEGITVGEVGVCMAAPSATMQLADPGARVSCYDHEP